MIHVWTRSTFNYLFNLNQKRIACHESYTDIMGKPIKAPCAEYGNQILDPSLI